MAIIAGGVNRTMAKPTLWALVVNSGRAPILPDPFDGNEPGPPEILLRSEGQNLRKMIARMSDEVATKGAAQKTADEFRGGPKQDDIRALVSRVAQVAADQVGKGSFRELAILATPEMIGTRKDVLSPTAKQSVVYQNAGDVTQLSEQVFRERVRTSLSQRK